MLAWSVFYDVFSVLVAQFRHKMIQCDKCGSDCANKLYPLRLPYQPDMWLCERCVTCEGCGSKEVAINPSTHRYIWWACRSCGCSTRPWKLEHLFKVLENAKIAWLMVSKLAGSNKPETFTETINKYRDASMAITQYERELYEWRK